MLRSLVGSEMCIRDSHKSAVLFVGCKNQFLPAFVVLTIVPFSPAHQPVCLLYTSDAADDLLCVDLGGRRIIKQKHIRILPQTITTRTVILQS